MKLNFHWHKPNFDDPKKTFFRGLIFLLPTFITIFILKWCWGVIDGKIATPISDSLLSFLTGPLGFEEGDLNKGFIKFLGLLLGLGAIFLVGLLSATLLGRRFARYCEKLMLGVPGIRAIYPYTKQIVDYFGGKNPEMKFGGVAALEYPRQGTYALGFLTGDGLKTIEDRVGAEMVSIYVPSSPTPVTGYVMFAVKSEIKHVDMSVDDALRFIVSGGVLVPPQQMDHSVPAKSEKAHTPNA